MVDTGPDSREMSILEICPSLCPGSTTAAPRSAYPGAPPPAPATLKGAQRPAMTSPASGIPGAPYRGTTWTQGYAPTQPAYRYTTPALGQTYAYTPHTTTQISPSFNGKDTAAKLSTLN
uniref:Uncharacterized protein n=1 Tax=Anopheles atroparvus TaxID=41427 RepID=A0A182ILZ5_ANOAO